MRDFLYSGCIALVLCLSPGPDLSAQDRGKDEDPELRLVRAQIGLHAAVMNRVSDLLEAESKGKDLRTALEKARERLLVSRDALGALKAEVPARTASILRQAEAVEARNKTRNPDSEAEKARTAKLASSKEVADYKRAADRLLSLAKERDKALREAASAGKDIRTDLEKAADRLNAALADSQEYQAAMKRLRAARRAAVVADIGGVEATSAPLRAALLRVEMAGKK